MILNVCTSIQKANTKHNELCGFSNVSVALTPTGIIVKCVKLIFRYMRRGKEYFDTPKIRISLTFYADVMYCMN